MKIIFIIEINLHIFYYNVFEVQNKAHLCMTPPPWPQRIVVGSTGMMQKESPDQKANGLRQLGLWRLKAGAMALPLVAPPVSAPSSPTATVKPSRVGSLEAPPAGGLVQYGLI